MLSNTTVYGLRAMIHLANSNQDQYISISKMSEELKISFHFLTKILQKLTQNKLLVSYRGPKGGVRLSKKPEDISIYEIVIILETRPMFTECILGIPGCEDDAPCPLHEEWRPLRLQIEHQFRTTSLAHLADKLEIFGKRLV
ncbi:MAG TPA: Rrf2 family transcriptional regulator [Caldithrix abyssi]|uniref:Rrf2 family transcriptional regulator n=1 Tax=Caldithrix abyssi TaxID=187145 RepID=A0A7V1LNU5_CALAY|nr:Rrf2 family transcriptional regulator [Caldithrix abyssi]